MLRYALIKINYIHHCTHRTFVRKFSALNGLPDELSCAPADPLGPNVLTGGEQRQQ